MAERPKLAYVDLKNFQGLYTKSSPEVISAEQLRVCENADFFEKYGAISKIKGSARVLTAPTNPVVPISWVGFYKASDLAGPILRHVLVANGTSLSRIDSGALTSLKTGRTSGLFHTADMLGRFMFITNQNPDKVGEGDQLVKYDGAVISDWGITPPGSEETVREPFDDATDWTTKNCTVTDESETTWDGEAIKIDKTITTTDSRHFEIDKAFNDPFYVIGEDRTSDIAIPNRISFFTFIPRGELTADCINTIGKFETEGPSMSVVMSPDADSVEANNWEFYFTIGQLVEGWNKLSLDFTSGPPGGNEKGRFYPEQQTVQRVKFRFNLVDDSVTSADIRLDRFNQVDEGAPIVTLSGSGNFTGVYSYKIVYVSKYGQLSNAGPQSRDVTAVSHGQLNLTNIPTSTDPQVTARRLYRTVANGSIWLFLDEILDNTTTTFTDTFADGSLGNETPPQAGDFSDDNSRPPQAGIVKVWKRTVFVAGDPQNPETLYFSEDDEPESFPLINAFQLDGKITAMYETYSGLVVETETGKWQVIGDNPDFSVDKIIEGMGCVGRRAAGTSRLIGYAVDRDGMRLFDLSNTKKISEPIRDRYDDANFINKVNIELMHTVHSKSRNLILQFNPDAAGEYTSIFAYMYPIDNVETGYWTDIVTPSAANLNFLDAEEIEDENGDFRIYVGADDGMVYELFCKDSTNWVDSGGTSFPIVTKFRTPYMREGDLGAETEGATGRVEPRFVEVRHEDDATTWNIKLETADGSSQPVARSTVDMNLQFGVNNSLIRQAVPGEEMIAAEYFRITLENSEAGVSSKILATRVVFHVQEGQFEVIDVDSTT